MKKRCGLLRVVALVCLTALLAVSLPLFAAAETPAEKYERLKEELEAARGAIESLKDDIDKTQRLKEALEEQKAILDEMVALNLNQIAATELQLEQKQAEVAEKRQVIYENDQLLRQRMVAIYNMNNSSMLSRLLMTESFSQFNMLTDSMRRVSQHDMALLELLRSEREALQTQLAEIDALLNELSGHHEELARNQEELVAALQQVDETLTEAQAQLAAHQQAEGQTAAALAQAQREMAAIAGSIPGSSRGDGSEFVGGRLGWPVPGYYDVSCEMGQPDPNGNPHRGMDVRAPNGASIVSCADGTVILATYAHSSYGNYIVVDHGGGVKSLYAHCSALMASPGQAVTKGQAIAAVGSTGFSTGNHLHLEVIDNGVLQNPRGWLQA